MRSRVFPGKQNGNPRCRERLPFPDDALWDLFARDDLSRGLSFCLFEQRDSHSYRCLCGHFNNGPSAILADFTFRIQDRAQFFEGKIGYLMFAFPTQINPCRPVVRIFANAHNSCFNFGFHAFIPSSCACPFSCSGDAPILITGARGCRDGTVSPKVGLKMRDPKFWKS
jgi:hypothetical protein